MTGRDFLYIGSPRTGSVWLWQMLWARISEALAPSAGQLLTENACAQNGRGRGLAEMGETAVEAIGQPSIIKTADSLQPIFTRDGCGTSRLHADRIKDAVRHEQATRHRPNRRIWVHACAP
jgi:hypothetical protein